MELKEWFKGFEEGISRLPQNQRETFFAECAKNCVKQGTLQIYQSLYERSCGDIDRFFTEAAKLPGVKCETVEKGRTYNLYFTECTCTLKCHGYVSTPQLCECSRQSILYVMHCLWKGRDFSVTLCHTILQGHTDCKMNIAVLPIGNANI